MRPNTIGARARPAKQLSNLTVADVAAADQPQPLTHVYEPCQQGSAVDSSIILSARSALELVEHAVNIASDRLHVTTFRNRSEEHTSELQSLMRISYAVFCLKKKTNKQNQ